MKKILSCICGLFCLVWVILPFTLSKAPFSSPVEGVNCLLELWQIDLFEGGQDSRASFLKARAIEFQKFNPKVLVFVRNVTITEMQTKLALGHTPDLVSISRGVDELIFPFVQPYRGSVSITDPLLASGKLNGEISGIAWYQGGYGLFAWQSDLDKQGISSADFRAQPIGGEVIYGKAAYNTPLNALSKSSLNIPYLFGERAESLKKKSNFQVDPIKAWTENKFINGFADKVNPVFNRGICEKKLIGNQTEAYVAFVSGKGMRLLGTQRDLVKLENAANKGRVGEYVFAPLVSFTDLVEYFCVLTSDELKRKMSEKFIAFMTSDSVQKKLITLKLFPVTGQKIYAEGIWQDWQDRFLQQER